jgi:hypothetical protein
MLPDGFLKEAVTENRYTMAVFLRMPLV